MRLEMEKSKLDKAPTKAMAAMLVCSSMRSNSLHSRVEAKAAGLFQGVSAKPAPAALRPRACTIIASSGCAQTSDSAEAKFSSDVIQGASN